MNTKQCLIILRKCPQLFRPEFFNHRLMSNHETKKKESDPIIKIKCESDPKPSIVRDRVTVIAHPHSKLKLFSYAIPVDETDYERRLRERKLEIQNRNHEYWCEINAEFNQKKKDFINNELKTRNPDVDFTSAQTHEELAQFYKRFLDENHRKYVEYNFEWYRNNLSLLWPSFVVSLIRIRRRFRSRPVKHRKKP